MQQAQPLETTGTRPHVAQSAAAIPRLRHAEAAQLGTKERERFLALLAELNGDDWEQPTACTLWDVKDIVAHQAGWQNVFSSFGGMRALLSKGPLQPYLERGMSQLDAINQLQVDRRADRSTAELIDEIRAYGPRSIAFRKRLPAPLRMIPLPDGDSGGFILLGYLTDTILTRDMWMHRLDICRATGRAFVQTADHDGRLVALVVRDLGRKLKAVLGGRTIVYHVTGASGGMWRFGPDATPAATLTMDTLDFNLLASERMDADTFLAEGRVQIEGDAALARTALEHTIVLY